ncbi:uncharacterized protein LOC135959662 [Calliphora vicina]|uniref:uncharacterized protein LOC135959662 n=1 Tax=Calliphora vicina TaxID=7373 RepID=UPI00325BEA0E
MNKNIICILILIVTIALCCRPLYGKPLDINSKEENYNDDGYNGNLDKKTIEQLRQCDMDLETMELCMRCAKITKSTIVYPLCCANEDKIKDWCHDYVFFGAL